MATIPRDLRAKRGDLILPKWVRMLEFIRNTGVVPGPGVKITQGPNGTFVFADKKVRPWAHPWKVVADSDGATVAAGLVNNVAPYIDGVPVTGVGEGGEAVTVPPVTIPTKQSGRTFIALVVHTREGPGGISVEDDPDLLQVQHVKTLDPAGAQGGVPDDNGTAVYPLAAIYWNESGGVRRTLQIAHHNLSHRFVAGSPETRGRHFFWAA